MDKKLQCGLSLCSLQGKKKDAFTKIAITAYPSNQRTKFSKPDLWTSNNERIDWLNGVLHQFQQYFNHSMATTIIIHVSPGFISTTLGPWNILLMNTPTKTPEDPVQKPFWKHCDKRRNHSWATFPFSTVFSTTIFIKIKIVACILFQFGRI